MVEILARSARQRWPEEEDIAAPFAVSSLFFLRYVCPFLFTIEQGTPQNVVFTMKQSAKILQAMANQTDLQVFAFFFLFY
jgi:hypothetical protein